MIKLSYKLIDASLPLPEVEKAIQQLENAAGRCLGVSTCSFGNDVPAANIVALDVVRPREPARTLVLKKITNWTPPPLANHIVVALGNLNLETKEIQVALYAAK